MLFLRAVNLDLCRDPRSTGSAMQKAVCQLRCRPSLSCKGALHDCTDCRRRSECLIGQPWKECHTASYPVAATSDVLSPEGGACSRSCMSILQPYSSLLTSIFYEMARKTRKARKTPARIFALLDQIQVTRSCIATRSIETGYCAHETPLINHVLILAVRYYIVTIKECIGRAYLVSSSQFIDLLSPPCCPELLICNQ